ncbi:MAG: hypothetical protein WCR69_04500 [Sulfuricurvum sp.]|jgi:hypothetical protein
MTKQQARKIAKLHMYSFFYLSNGFSSEVLSEEDDQKVTDEIKAICKKEIEKLGLDSQTESNQCAAAVLEQ